MIVRPKRKIRTTRFVQVLGTLGNTFEEQVVEREIGGTDACPVCTAKAEMEYRMQHK